MRRARHVPIVDVKHLAVAQRFQAYGASVLDLSRLGFGAPDLLVGFCGINELVEVKGQESGLTAWQTQFQNMWQGREVRVVRDERGVKKLLGHMQSQSQRASVPAPTRE